MAGKFTERSLRRYAAMVAAVAALLALSPARALAAGAAAELAPAPSIRLAPPAELAPPPARFVIRLAQVVAAIGASKLPLDGAAITLPAPMIANRAEPPLEVRSIEPWGDRRARVLVRCAEHSACLPFYAVAEWPTAASAEAVLPAPIRITGSSRSRASADRTTLAFLRTRDADAAIAAAAPAGLAKDVGVAAPPTSAASALLAVSPAAAAEQPASSAPTMVRAGMRATLLLEEGRIHIEVPVVCLEEGSRGRRIRVRELHSKQTYMAEVMDASMVKGTL